LFSPKKETVCGGFHKVFNYKTTGFQYAYKGTHRYTYVDITDCECYEIF